MKTDRLEEFINQNREAFDQYEPSAKVWEQISKSKPKPKIVTFTTWFLRVAAVLAVVAIFSVAITKTNIFNSGNFAQQSDDPDLRELIEAEAFYASQVNEKMDEIRKCYVIYPEIKEDVEMDLNELQQMYNVLKTDLKENVSKKTVIEAMIENNRYRLKMVDEVLDQINC
jgi:hypothetical protein